MVVGPAGLTLTPRRVGDRYRLDGVKLFVSDATYRHPPDVVVRLATGRAISGCC